MSTQQKAEGAMEKPTILKQGGAYTVQREFNRLFGRTGDKDRVLVYLAHKIEKLEARIVELEKKPKLGRPKKEKSNGTIDVSD
jgi:shikimate kinase|tara:strand:+ start:613 stop:861 length:249 start_codon:yes stop_codon:yes gene_type:complete